MKWLPCFVVLELILCRWKPCGKSALARHKRTQEPLQGAIHGMCCCKQKKIHYFRCLLDHVLYLGSGLYSFDKDFKNTLYIHITMICLCKNYSSGRVSIGYEVIISNMFGERTTRQCYVPNIMIIQNCHFLRINKPHIFFYEPQPMLCMKPNSLNNLGKI